MDFFCKINGVSDGENSSDSAIALPTCSYYFYSFFTILATPTGLGLGTIHGLPAKVLDPCFVPDNAWIVQNSHFELRMHALTTLPGAKYVLHLLLTCTYVLPSSSTQMLPVNSNLAHSKNTNRQTWNPIFNHTH